MSNPKEIADKILDINDREVPWWAEYAILARAYLELEKEKAKLILHIDDIEKANDNCQTKIANLELEISKHKKSRDVLRKAVEFYGDKENWAYSAKIYEGGMDFIEVKEEFDWIENNKAYGGKKAREAIKADDEIMK